jgi:hypothetical protein
MIVKPDVHLQRRVLAEGGGAQRALVWLQLLVDTLKCMNGLKIFFEQSLHHQYQYSEIYERF